MTHPCIGIMLSGNWDGLKSCCRYNSAKVMKHIEACSQLFLSRLDYDFALSIVWLLWMFIPSAGLEIDRMFPAAICFNVWITQILMFTATHALRNLFSSMLCDKLYLFMSCHTLCKVLMANIYLLIYSGTTVALTRLSLGSLLFMIIYLADIFSRIQICFDF